MKTLKILGVGLVLAMFSSPLFAFTYSTTITGKDRYNSSGDRLTSVRAILRQDRANMYRFDNPNAGDQDDPAFGSYQNRGMFDSAPINVSPGLSREIVGGGPVGITVDVTRNGISVYRG